MVRSDGARVWLEPGPTKHKFASVRTDRRVKVQTDSVKIMELNSKQFNQALSAGARARARIRGARGV